MKKRKKIRDLIYVNGEKSQEGLFVFYGIEFQEFMGNLTKPIKNLLLLKHSHQFADFHFTSLLEYVSLNKIESLINDDVYSYGTFSWIDFEELPALDSLSPTDMAEILYFRHFGRPLNKVFFDQLNNSFAFYGHDDGCISEVYSKNVFEFSNILSNVIVQKVNAFTKRKIRPLNLEAQKKLLEFTKDGLFIEFQKINNDRTHIDIPFTTIGNHTDMDFVYDKRFELDQYSHHLTYEYGEWEIKVTTVNS